MILQTQKDLDVAFGMLASAPMKALLCNEGGSILGQNLCILWWCLWQKITFLHWLDKVVRHLFPRLQHILTLGVLYFNSCTSMFTPTTAFSSRWRRKATKLWACCGKSSSLGSALELSTEKLQSLCCSSAKATNVG